MWKRTYRGFYLRFCFWPCRIFLCTPVASLESCLRIVQRSLPLRLFQTVLTNHCCTAPCSSPRVTYLTHFCDSLHPSNLATAASRSFLEWQTRGQSSACAASARTTWPAPKGAPCFRAARPRRRTCSAPNACTKYGGFLSCLIKLRRVSLSTRFSPVFALVLIRHPFGTNCACSTFTASCDSIFGRLAATTAISRSTIPG
jgi:hypothetical protein